MTDLLPDIGMSFSIDLSWRSIILTLPFRNRNKKQTFKYTSMIRLLVTLYNFHQPGGYWNSLENRRNFFIEIAEQKGFDPLIIENWNNVTHEEFRKKQVLREFV